MALVEVKATVSKDILERSYTANVLKKHIEEELIAGIAKKIYLRFGKTLQSVDNFKDYSTTYRYAFHIFPDTEENR